MPKIENIRICKRCGKITEINFNIHFVGLAPGHYAGFVKCEDCKFSLRNLWKALTKKEDS